MKIVENMPELYTDKLEERVHFVKDDSDFVINLENFFKELMSRKRNDTKEQIEQGQIEGGLQATGLIFNSIGAFKINDNDGLDAHGLTELNLLKAIEYNLNEDAEQIFATRRMAQRFMLYKDDTEKILLYGTSVRIICSNDELTIIFIENNKELNNFKKAVICEVARICLSIKNSNLLKNIFFTFGDSIVSKQYRDFCEDDYNDVISTLSSDDIIKR